MTRAALRRLVELASARYRPAGRHAYHFARGKLAKDPLYAELLRHALIPADADIVDLGCGQALVGCWLLAAQALQRQQGWPAQWPLPPQPASYRGIELMRADVERARAALAEVPDFSIEQHDICSVDLGAPDVVLALDVLHYIGADDQAALLARIREALPAHGLLLMRVGDAGAGLRYRFSSTVDALICRLRGLRVASLHGRPLAQWLNLLADLGYAVEALPMSAGTPFANTLLAARPAASDPSGVRTDC